MLVCQETALRKGPTRDERSPTSGQLRLFAHVLCRGVFLGPGIDQSLPERTLMRPLDIRNYRIGIER